MRAGDNQIMKVHATIYAYKIIIFDESKHVFEPKQENADFLEGFRNRRT